MINEDLIIDIHNYLIKNRKHKACNDLLHRLEKQTNPRYRERLWVLIFRTTKPKDEHKSIQSTIADISGNQMIPFLMGDYGGSKFGTCLMFECSLSQSLIITHLEGLVYGDDDVLFLAPISSGWASTELKQLDRWLTTI